MAGAFCQTTLDLPSQSRNANFSKATSTTPWQIGTSLPQSCSVGQAYFKTDASPGLNVYTCTSANQWTVATGSGDLSSFSKYSTGSGAPATSCTAGRDLYTDTTNEDTWFCADTNIWKKVLSSANSGPMLIRGQTGPAPATPVSGTTAFYFDSTAKLGQTKDDAGNLATMVRPADCSTSNGFAQKINADGSVTCAAGGSGGGAGPWVFATQTASYGPYTGGTFTPLTFDTNRSDTSSGAMHSTSSNTSRFVAPGSGVYLTTCQAYFGTAGSYIELRKNGATILLESGSYSTIAFSPVTGAVLLNANDYLECMVYPSVTSAPQNLGPGGELWTYMQFIKLF